VNAWFACDDGPGVLADFTAGFQAVDAEARGVDAVLPDGDGVCAGEVVDGEDDTHDEIYNQRGVLYTGVVGDTTTTCSTTMR
jgi:hypothetical protein